MKHLFANISNCLLNEFANQVTMVLICLFCGCNELAWCLNNLKTRGTEPIAGGRAFDLNKRLPSSLLTLFALSRRTYPL